jgi:hypothetical protein
MRGKHRAVRHSGGAGPSRLVRGCLAFMRGIIPGRRSEASLFVLGVGLIAWAIK